MLNAYILLVNHVTDACSHFFNHLMHDPYDHLTKYIVCCIEWLKEGYVC